MVSADHVNNEYSIDVLVHNRYHVGYTWNDEQEGLVTIEVEEFPADIIQNFLPDGTVITVKQDGTGDFTDVQTAIDSLDGKYSNGVVTIEIGEGTFSRDKRIFFAPICNFNKLIIKGAGIGKTILKCTNGNADESTISLKGAYDNLYIENLSIDGTNKISFGIDFDATNIRLTITNVEIKNSSSAIYVRPSCDLLVGGGNLNIINCTKAIDNSGGNVYLRSCTLNLLSVTTALSVDNGGIIRIRSAVRKFTSVSNQTSQSIGTANTSGYIAGNWS